MSEKIENRGGSNRGQGRHAKNWKPLNLKIDAELSDYLDNLSLKKGDKTLIVETFLRALKNDVKHEIDLKEKLIRKAFKAGAALSMLDYQISKEEIANELEDFLDSLR